MPIDPLSLGVIALIGLIVAAGGKKKKKKNGKPGRAPKGDYQDTTKKKGKGKAKDSQKKGTGEGSKGDGDPDQNLGDDGLYDQDFFWEVCGPGWVLEQESNGNEVCVWWSDYAAPADLGPLDLWIAPDCYAVVVGRDWWDDVAQEFVREAFDAGLGGVIFLTDDMSYADTQWVTSYEFVIYDLLSQYLAEDELACLEQWPWHTSWGVYADLPYPSQDDFMTVEEIIDEETQSSYEMDVLDDEGFNAAVAEWQAGYNLKVEAFMEEFEMLGVLVDGLLKAASSAATGAEQS